MQDKDGGKHFCKSHTRTLIYLTSLLFRVVSHPLSPKLQLTQGGLCEPSHSRAVACRCLLNFMEMEPISLTNDKSVEDFLMVSKTFA